MQEELLNDFWLTSNPIDFEYKKYLMLAYNQKKTKQLSEHKIYPHLTDVVNKLMYVNSFLKNMILIEKSAKKLDKINWLTKEVIYKSKFEDDSFDEVKDIAFYSQDVLSDLYIKFKNLYDDVDGSIVISGNQLSVFDKYKGYLILKYERNKEKILNYEIYKTIIPEPTFHLKTSKVDPKEYYENRYTSNIFEILVNEKFPPKETMIPVVRRKFLMYINGGYLL